MTSNIIYFELNDWEPNEDYPNEEPFKTWMEALPCPLTDDKWAKENKLCIVYEFIDQSMNYCITANKDWIERNCPRLLTHYQQFLREPENNETYGYWGTKFLEYKPENFGSNYMISKDIECFECKYGENCPVFWSKHNAACLTIRQEKDEYEEQVAWDYKEHEYPYN